MENKELSIFDKRKGFRFESVTAAAKFFAEGTDFSSMRRKRSVIYHAVSGYRRSAFGYTWQYV